MRRFGPRVLREGSSFELRQFVEQCEHDRRHPIISPQIISPLPPEWEAACADAKRFLVLIRAAGECVYTTAESAF